MQKNPWKMNGKEMLEALQVIGRAQEFAGSDYAIEKGTQSPEFKKVSPSFE